MRLQAEYGVGMGEQQPVRAPGTPATTATVHFVLIILAWVERQGRLHVGCRAVAVCCWPEDFLCACCGYHLGRHFLLLLVTQFSSFPHDAIKIAFTSV